MCIFAVTPLVGVWIEIPSSDNFGNLYNVTPLVGVWIEILYVVRYDVGSLSSLPLWECGLKSFKMSLDKYYIEVTPLVGVWIEILWSLLF